MVSSQDGDSVLEADLEGDQKRDSLDRVVTSVYVVSHEEIVGVGRLASDLEKLSQVVELSVDISADCHWGFHSLHI